MILNQEKMLSKINLGIGILCAIGIIYLVSTKKNSNIAYVETGVLIYMMLYRSRDC